jgi:hypothetical protein
LCAAISCGTLDIMKLEQTTFINGNRNLLYPKISFFLSSRVYRDPTVPITQYNGLCHVTGTTTARPHATTKNALRAAEAVEAVAEAAKAEYATPASPRSTSPKTALCLQKFAP